jgi:hypothetical protein
MKQFTPKTFRTHAVFFAAPFDKAKDQDEGLKAQGVMVE